VDGSVRRSLQIVKNESAALLADVPAANKADATAALARLKTSLEEFSAIVANKDKQEARAWRAVPCAVVCAVCRVCAVADNNIPVVVRRRCQVPLKQQECLNEVGIIEEAMVDGARAHGAACEGHTRALRHRWHTHARPHTHAQNCTFSALHAHPPAAAPRLPPPGFPFDIPAPYDTLPALKGRAEVEMTFTLKEGRASNPNQKRGSLTVVLDGYNAPVSAGNFVDLVQRKFYDGMDVQRSDGFVVQSGDPSGPEVGFVDPATRAVRKVPLEIMVKGDKVPLYGDTLEDVRRFREDPALPFNAFGTLALAREEFDNNSASSQFFFLLKESELTPSGTNILDGRYGVFGYVVEGQELLRDVKVGDTIESIKVTKGAQYMVNTKGSAPAAAPAAEEAAPAAEAQ
jgi:cyclophilin family peptidyl-prolyl cis-trans isomerase